MVNSRIKRIEGQLRDINSKRNILSALEEDLHQELAEAKQLVEGFQVLKQLFKQL
jgi:F0F1-type ATP synthase membrane subunit b/b'